MSVRITRSPDAANPHDRAEFCVECGEPAVVAGPADIGALCVHCCHEWAVIEAGDWLHRWRIAPSESANASARRIAKAMVTALRGGRSNG